MSVQSCVLHVQCAIRMCVCIVQMYILKMQKKILKFLDVAFHDRTKVISTVLLCTLVNGYVWLWME